MSNENREDYLVNTSEGSVHQENLIISKAKKIIESRISNGNAITNPQLTKDYLILHCADKKNEAFSVLFLNTRNKVIAFDELFQGTIDGCSVYPRVVAQRCLQLNASAVIFSHNHPSGDPDPSHADQVITTRLKDALTLFDIRVLDHIIVGGAKAVSLAERGIL